MATYITPDYIYDRINQKRGETRQTYLDRLSRMMLDETCDPMVSKAAARRLQEETNYQ